MSTHGAIPVAGEYFYLTCNVHGAEKLNPIITYQWRKSGDSSPIGTNSNMLPFTPFRVSDIGNYSCSVTVTSNYLVGNITAVTYQVVRIQSKFEQYCTHGDT